MYSYSKAGFLMGDPSTRRLKSPPLIMRISLHKLQLHETMSCPLSSCTSDSSLLCPVCSLLLLFKSHSFLKGTTQQ